MVQSLLEFVFGVVWGHFKHVIIVVGGHARVHGLHCGLTRLKLLISAHRESSHFETSLHKLLLVFVYSSLDDALGIQVSLSVYQLGLGLLGVH